MKKFSIFLLLIISVCSCNNNHTPKTTIDGLALGTTYHIVICEDTLMGTKDAINRCFDSANQSCSIFNANSLLSKINRNETDSLDNILTECITKALEISHQSNGLYDITIKPLTDALGFAAKEKSTSPNIDSLLQFVGYNKISIQNLRLTKENPGVQIDLNSIAKGHTVDLVSRALEALGYENFLVEIGGEIVARGINTHSNHKWRIGIDKPTEGNMTPGAELVELINLSNQALATSGNYRRYYTNQNGDKIVHTINPKTGESSPSNLLSATVIAENCTLADGYATALMSMGLERAVKFAETHPELIIYLIYSNQEGKFETYGSEKLKGTSIN